METRIKNSASFASNEKAPSLSLSLSLSFPVYLVRDLSAKKIKAGLKMSSRARFVPFFFVPATISGYR